MSTDGGLYVHGGPGVAMARPKFKLFAAAAAPWLVTGAIGLTSGASRTRLGVRALARRAGCACPTGQGD